MKKAKRIIAPMALLLAVVFSLTTCTQDNQVLDLNPATPNTDTLFSTKVSTAPNFSPIGGAAWDGTIDPAWDNASKLTVGCTVPDLGNNTFTGFIGNTTNVTLRSLYDDNNIYMLVEFDAAQKNVESSPWYFNPSTKRWAQESGTPVLNPDGVTFRPPFIQDQFVIAFNTANSCLNFITQSCYAACHVNSSYGGTDTPEGGVMYTNGPSEILDCWRARMLQVMNENQANDCFIDDGSSVAVNGYGGSSGTLNKNEVHSDWQINNGTSGSVPIALQSPGIPADGGFSNRQSKTMTGTSTKVNVPIWVIPSGTYSNGAIKIGDTTGLAVKVTAVDTNGVLTLANGTTIDPSTAASGTDYQQVGAGDGPKCIPGSVVDVYTGSRADVTANAYYTGTGWRIMLKRALKTSDGTNDTDFSSLEDQPFGIGVMFNGADNEHAIANGLLLRFVK